MVLFRYFLPIVLFYLLLVIFDSLFFGGPHWGACFLLLLSGGICTFFERCFNLFVLGKWK